MLDYFDRPGIIRKFWIMLYVVCALIVLPDLFMHRHAYFGVDGYFAFYAVLGFVSCAALILLSKALGLLLKKKENYYDR